MSGSAGNRGVTERASRGGPVRSSRSEHRAVGNRSGHGPARLRRWDRATRRGLTLLEVMIAIALISLLLSALMAFFWQTLRLREEAAATVDRTQLVQQILDHIATELRDAVPAEQTGFPVVTFTGERRKITFLTNPLPPAESYDFYRASQRGVLPAMHDLREITYELWVDPEETLEGGEPLVGGLLRTERRAIDPYITEEEVSEDEDLLYIRHDLWSAELGYLEFRYFDGVEWTTSWQVSEGNPLPHLVQVTVGFDSLTRDDLEDRDLDRWPVEEYPLGPDVPVPGRYSTIVRIAAADAGFSARVNRLGGAVEQVFQFGGATEEGDEDRTGEEGGP